MRRRDAATQTRCGWPFWQVEEIEFVFLDESLTGEAEILIISYYYVVEDFYVHDTSGIDQFFCQFLIALTRFWISRRMIMDENQ